MNNRRLGAGLIPAMVLSAGSAVGGQPMVTDDAGVLGKGGWEYQLWVEQDIRDSGDTWLAPNLEIAYGFTDQLQGALAIARLVVDEPGADSRSDFDAIGFELKWQFYRGEQWSVAAAPAYAFPLTSSSTDRGLVDDVRVFSLPLIATWERGNWSVDANLSLDIPSSGDNSTFAGVVGGYQLNERLKLLAEVYRNDVSGAREDETNFNVGFDLSIGEGLAVLFSIGSGISSNLADPDELDRAAFLGFRYDTE